MVCSLNCSSVSDSVLIVKLILNIKVVHVSLFPVLRLFPLTFTRVCLMMRVHVPADVIVEDDLVPLVCVPLVQRFGTGTGCKQECDRLACWDTRGTAACESVMNRLCSVCLFWLVECVW